MKKITALIICVIMLTAAAVSVFAEALILPDEYLGKAGDVNMDGETDNKDIAALFRYVSGVKVEVDKKAADCNGDGAIDNKDVPQLFRYLSGQPVELKYGKDDTEGTEETGEQVHGEIGEAPEEETEMTRLFKKLWEINEDIGAWITMPGTAINHPIVQGRNNIH